MCKSQWQACGQVPAAAAICSWAASWRSATLTVNSIALICHASLVFYAQRFKRHFSRTQGEILLPSPFPTNETGVPRQILGARLTLRQSIENCCATMVLVLSQHPTLCTARGTLLVVAACIFTAESTPIKWALACSAGILLSRPVCDVDCRTRVSPPC